MPSKAEVEAAAKAIQKIEDPLEFISKFMPTARAALEAAERVREEELACKADWDEATERVCKVRAEFG